VSTQGVGGDLPIARAKDQGFDRKGQTPTEYFKEQLFELEAMGLDEEEKATEAA